MEFQKFVPKSPTMESKINIVIVDDQTLVRQGLVGLFNDHPTINVVHEAGNGIEIIDWFSQKDKNIKVDVVLMDIQMPKMDGCEATEILVRKYNDLKIIGLSSYDNEAFIDRFIKNGGRAYLLKVQDIEEVEEAIEQVMSTGYYFTDRVPISKIADYVNDLKISPLYNTSQLTTQETRIVQLICQEKTSQEIADELFVSKKTIETHRDRILSKIKARNMVGIVMYAIKHKLVNFN